MPVKMPALRAAVANDGLDHAIPVDSSPSVKDNALNMGGLKLDKGQILIGPTALTAWLIHASSFPR